VRALSGSRRDTEDYCRPFLGIDSQVITDRLACLSARAASTETQIDRVVQLNHPAWLKLRDRVDSLVPRVDLPDAVLKLHTLTSFIDEFRSHQRRPRVSRGFGPQHLHGSRGGLSAWRPWCPRKYGLRLRRG
jgi:hypothetical protein